jgi:hypothetical protein
MMKLDASTLTQPSAEIAWRTVAAPLYAAGLIETLSDSLEQAERRRRLLALAVRLREHPPTAFR